jgi:hypothetical protein
MAATGSVDHKPHAVAAEVDGVIGDTSRARERLAAGAAVRAVDQVVLACARRTRSRLVRCPSRAGVVTADVPDRSLFVSRAELNEGALKEAGAGWA